MKEDFISIRQPRPPFCWQSKTVLNFIRGRVPEEVLSSVLLLYFVLTELASDNHGAADFRASYREIERKSGLSRSTVIRHLRRLAEIGAVATSANFAANGRQLPSSLVILPAEEIFINRGGGCHDTPLRDTPILRRIEEEEESPLTPHGGASSDFSFPTLEEVRAYAVESCLSDGSAERFHRMNEAGNWRDRSGKQIQNWRRAFLAFAKKDREPETVPTATAKPDRTTKTRKPKPNFLHAVHHEDHF